MRRSRETECHRERYTDKEIEKLIDRHVPIHKDRDIETETKTKGWRNGDRQRQTETGKPI